MDSSSAVLNIVVKLQDEASDKLKTLSENVGSGNFKKAAEVVADSAMAMGASFIAASGYSIKMATDFQSSMTLIQTQAGASAQEVDNMSKAILALAPTVGSTPKQLAEALFYIESAGYSGAKALDILKLSAEGAKVGEADLTDTAKAVTSVLNSHIKGVKDASDAMGQMNAIVGAGKMKMEDLNAALSSGILASAQSFGISLKDVGAALDTMTNAGVPAEDAATRLRMTFSLIETPTTKATNALKSIGMTSREMADDMRKGGLIDALDDLNKHMNAVQPATTVLVKGTKESGAQLAKLQQNIAYTTDRLKILNETHVKSGPATDSHNLAILRATNSLAGYQAKLGSANQSVTTFGGGVLDATHKAQLMSDMFGGGRTSSAMLTLVQNMDQVKSRLKQVGDTSNNFGAEWKKTQEDAGFANARFVASLQTIAIQYGNVLLPIYTKVVNFLADNLGPAVNAVSGWWKEHQTQIMNVANVVIKNLVMAFQFFWFLIQGMFIPILQKLQLMWQEHHKQIVIIAEVLAGILMLAIGGVIIIIGTLINIVVEVVKELLDFGSWVAKVGKSVIDIFTQIGVGWQRFKDIFMGVLDTISLGFKTFVNGIVDGFNIIIKGVDSIGKVGGGKGLNIPVIPHLASGTNFFQGGVALVGEQGPELVNLPRGSQVIPNNMINSNNTNSAQVQVGPVYIQDISDINQLVQRLDWQLRTSGRYAT